MLDELDSDKNWNATNILLLLKEFDQDLQKDKKSTNKYNCQPPINRKLKKRAKQHVNLIS